jgi:hypothetical protein
VNSQEYKHDAPASVFEQNVPTRLRFVLVSGPNVVRFHHEGHEAHEGGAEKQRIRWEVQKTNNVVVGSLVILFFPGLLHDLRGVLIDLRKLP